MIRLTDSQRVKIVRLFQCGTSMADLAQAWDTPIATIEGIIRDAMKNGEAA